MEQNKIKSYILRIFPYLNILSILIDIFVLYKINQFCSEKEGAYQLIPIAYLIFLGYRFFKSMFLVTKGTSDAKDYIANNRVIGVCGKQRAGKSSLSMFFLSLLGGSLLTNIPSRIKGRFTKQLTTDVLCMNERMPADTSILIDECNLFYNALRTGKYNESCFGQSVLCQLIGHISDGNIIYCATEVGRIPKEIRTQFSSKLQLLGQSSYDFAPIGAFCLRFIFRHLFKLDVHTGIRIWRAQHYEKVMDDAYVAVLGDSENKFAPVYQFATLQNPLKFEYDDRYMRYIYERLPEGVLVPWEKFELDLDTLLNLSDSELITYINNKIYQIEEAKVNDVVVPGE